MRRRWLGLGLGLAGVYVVVAMATAQLSPRRVRPLFDGFAPPAPYNWVNPPPSFFEEGTKPRSGQFEVSLSPDAAGSPSGGTPDGQALVAAPSGSVPARPPDTGAAVVIAPFDAQTLGPLPSGVRILSNAYQVTVTYQPSSTPLTTLAVPGQISLVAAAPADTMVFSADGKTWRTVASTPFGDRRGLTATFVETGYFLAASTQAAAPAPSSSEWWKTPWLYVAAVLVAAGAAYGGSRQRARRRRRVRSRPGPRTSTGAARPKSKKTTVRPNTGPKKSSKAGKKRRRR